MIPRLRVAFACNPCAAKKACSPCNPCAAKKACSPCNPCAAKKACSPCNPCAVKKASACSPCAAKNACSPCNPCAVKKASACSPCAAKNACSPCNPCAAKNPCNPCAAKNPCNPCAAKNPCNPCGAAAVIELTSAEAKAAYDCLRPEITAAYAKAGVTQVAEYSGWTNVAARPYQSDTHGNRYVNNFVNKNGAFRYSRFEDGGAMPAGTVIAKDSFTARPDGGLAVGPLFVMEKQPGGFNSDSGNWRYTMVMPNGSVMGMTKGQGDANVKFCNTCHKAMAEDQDYMFFLPDEYRAKN